MTTPHKNYEMELNRLLTYTLEADASDLHLLAGRPPIIRVQRGLEPIPNYPVYSNEDLEKVIGAMLGEQLLARLKTARHVDFSHSMRDNSRFRVNVYYQKGTIAAALRYIPARIRTLEELALPEELKGFAQHKQGLVLYVGPTGHGKSTTLAALIDIINQGRAEHIITIEDPIEYIFTPAKSIISQREVHLDTPDFASAIRATLREDADVVMVGEMRDLESIQSTITVAETGHLVFATLHTNDAPQTIDRIIDVFPSHQQNQIRSQLANILVAVVSQRLLNRVGGGLVPAIEILSSNNAVQNVIREGRSYELPNIVHTSSKDGMISLDMSLANLVRKGTVTMEDAVRYARNVDVFKSLINRF